MRLHCTNQIQDKALARHFQYQVTNRKSSSASNITLTREQVLVEDIGPCERLSHNITPTMELGLVKDTGPCEKLSLSNITLTMKQVLSLIHI